MEQPLEKSLQEVAQLLLRGNSKIVFAESCTGGLLSATLSRVPGISAVHCGSAVVYRLDTKTRWLGVPAALLVDPGPVSEPVARAMSEGVLARTPEADVAISITGHLGPDAPTDQDGLVFVGIAIRGASSHVIEHCLARYDRTAESYRFPGTSEREQRQWEAVEFVFAQIAAALSSEIPTA